MDFTCGTVSSNGTFISGNSLYSKLCGVTVPTRHIVPDCSSNPFPHGIRLFADVDIVREQLQGAGTATAYPETRVSNSGIELFLFYDNPAQHITVYKSEPVTFVTDNLKSVAYAATFTPSPYNWPPPPAHNQGCEGNAPFGGIGQYDYYRAGNVYDILGPKQFDYTLFAVDCHLAGHLQDQVNFYVLYNKHLIYDDGAADGDYYDGYGGLMNINCDGSVNYTPNTTPLFHPNCGGITSNGGICSNYVTVKNAYVL
jgi:hypothetical protein